MGSGGHTAEMLRLLNHLNFDNYSPRLYIMADSDTSTETKIVDLEKRKASNKTSHSVHRIPRSRSVNQSYLSIRMYKLVDGLCSDEVIPVQSDLNL
ncbi:hypothetical protein J437_LFUL002634 [Ladona fulva]|uniref:UDP-N-acetylglucosamine transferase subunit ALG14 n=1 Tax=Ladona fulva TaxID=123851 RepID=A0A8K0JW20_LADFU|nr:hypothetical protein J437_LFUL002634 [Ladona fulva]